MTGNNDTLGAIYVWTVPPACSSMARFVIITSKFTSYAICFDDVIRIYTPYGSIENNRRSLDSADARWKRIA